MHHGKYVEFVACQLSFISTKQKPKSKLFIHFYPGLSAQTLLAPASGAETSEIKICIFSELWYVVHIVLQKSVVRQPFMLFLVWNETCESENLKKISCSSWSLGWYAYSECRLKICYQILSASSRVVMVIKSAKKSFNMVKRLTFSVWIIEFRNWNLRLHALQKEVTARPFRTSNS